jgi:hypothetical protein
MKTGKKSRGVAPAKKKLSRRVGVSSVNAAPRRVGRSRSSGEIVKLVKRAAKGFNDVLDTVEGQAIILKEGIYTKTGQLTKHYR